VNGDDREVVERELRRRAKLAIRKKMRGVRAALPASAIEARSSKVRERVLALTPLVEAKTVLLFASLEHEVATDPLLDALAQQGKRLVLPRVQADELVLHEVSVDTPLEPGAFSVPEPPVEARVVEPGTVDFALVPALAVDVRGFRIGYGGGYYDRLLPTLSGASTCAVAFDFQLVAEVPEFPFDAPVDWVVTDARTLDARSERAGEA
jgi:5-formyltetrahydrofolate cyclo-ligase